MKITAIEKEIRKEVEKWFLDNIGYIGISEERAILFDNLCLFIEHLFKQKNNYRQAITKLLEGLLMEEKPVYMSQVSPKNFDYNTAVNEQNAKINKLIK